MERLYGDPRKNRNIIKEIYYKHYLKKTLFPIKTPSFPEEILMNIVVAW